MSQNRIIPFGYKVEKSKIVTVENEADAVKRIFSLYLRGETLKKIAAHMEATGIRYHADSNAWNKNMIKRILENDRYIGADNYPMIISAKDYLAVRLKNQEMQSHRTPRLDSLKSIGNNIRCSKCGAILHRHTNAGRARWICANEECREIVNIPDTSLRTEIDRCLDRLALSPALLDPCAPDEQQVSPDVLRLKNELTAAFNRGSESPEYMRSLIFALAAEQYNALPDMSLIHTLKELQDRIAAEGITEDNRREIEQKAVRRILLSRESGVSIELINGKIISSKEEAEQ